MPIFEYRCNDCGTKYEIYHKVHELIENIECPDCKSGEFTKLISAVSIGSMSKQSSPAPACGIPGVCSSGNCSLGFN
jgi:putative FmdB family regulatory protein